MFPAGSRILVCDPRLCLFLPLWLPHLTGLMIIRADPEDGPRRLRIMQRERVTLDAARSVIHHYESTVLQRAAGMEPKIVVTPVRFQICSSSF